MKEQGYKLKKNEVRQDNMSTIRMEKNGRNSCTGNSRHVDIWYFFVNDRVDKRELTIEYCPRTEILADFFTKPLQVTLFKKMRAVFLGWEAIKTLRAGYESHIDKERVENTGKVSMSDVTSKDTKRTYADVVSMKNTKTNESNE